MQGQLRNLKIFLKHDALLSIQDFLEREDAAHIIETEYLPTYAAPVAYMKGARPFDHEFDERVTKIRDKIEALLEKYVPKLADSAYETGSDESSVYETDTEQD
jgi:hypothetical protein